MNIKQKYISNLEEQITKAVIIQWIGGIGLIIWIIGICLGNMGSPLQVAAGTLLLIFWWYHLGFENKLDAERELKKIR